MAETKISGRDWIVSLDIEDNDTFLPVACLTTNSLNSDREPIDTTSKCGDEMEAGDSITQVIEGSGFAINQTGDIEKESYNTLYTLLANGSIVNARFGPASPTTGDIYYEGQVLVTTLNLTAEDKAKVTFDVTFTVFQPPMTQTTY